MNEDLLTQDMIEYIKNKAIYSWLNNPGIIYKVPSEKNGLDIIHISPLKKLVFIDGDDLTGTSHFFKRHRYYTNSFSKIEKGYIKTSRFNKDGGTLPEISAIADVLYDERMLNLKDNKNPELLELYEGKILEMNQTFRMFIYKGSKIIHTLFPVEHGKPVKQYQRMDIQVEYRDWEIARVVIPYIDVKDIVRFGIGGILKIHEGQEKWSVIFYRTEKDGISHRVATASLSEIKVVYKYSIEIRFEQINFMDFTKQENQIIKLIKKDTKLQELMKDIH